MTAEEAAQLLDGELRKYPWYLSTEVNVTIRGRPTLFVLVEGHNHPELERFKTGWQGYDVVVNGLTSAKTLAKLTRPRPYSALAVVLLSVCVVATVLVWIFMGTASETSNSRPTAASDVTSTPTDPEYERKRQAWKLCLERANSWSRETSASFWSNADWQTYTRGSNGSYTTIVFVMIRAVPYRFFCEITDMKVTDTRLLPG